MARLNFAIPDDLHDEMRDLAAQRGQTLKGLVIFELRRAVQRSRNNPSEAFEADGQEQ